MKNISFDNGVREYAVNGNEAEPIRINVTDLNLPKRLESAQKRLDEIAAEYSSGLTPENASEADAELRKLMAEVFGSDVCTAAFGNTNCLTPVNGGEFLITAFLKALMPAVTADIKAAAGKESPSDLRPEVAKYLPEKSENPQPMTKEEKAAIIARLLEE